MFRKLATFMGTIIGVVIVVGGGIAIMTGMNAMRPRPDIPKNEPVPPSVFYVVAETAERTLDIFVQGEVRSRTDINLTAEVSGKIVETGPAFVDGGAFKKDDVLLQIEDANYRLAVTRAEARVAQARQALRQEQAEAALAQRDWEELGTGERPSDLTLRVPQLAQAQANFDAARADHEEAKLNLDRTRVRAPFDGRIRTRNVGLGQFVNPGAQLGRIFSTDVAEIRLALTDQNLAIIGLPFSFLETAETPGPKAELSATIGGQTHTWYGRIARTEGAIDPSTRQIGAIAVVDDPYGTGSDSGVPLAVGLFVDAKISGRPIGNAISLPLSALHGRDTVYVISRENTLETRTVQIAASTPQEFIVVNGLAVGERVVTSPLRGNEAGDTVTPVDPNASSTTARGQRNSNGGEERSAQANSNAAGSSTVTSDY